MNGTLILIGYAALLGVLAMYGSHRLAHLRRFRWRARASAEAGLEAAFTGELPVVTVQLPLYNERTVAARLMRAVAELDWPRDRLEIQVLDDSTDETRSIVDGETAALVDQGLDAQVLRRFDRKGFKAGALAAGLARARGEILCVFDADFVPPRDFLRRLLPHFQDPGVGMVQARWGHLNRDDSTLTRAQAALLDGHFVIEHKVRFDSGWFFNFNGTAGAWRRAAIEDAGGWQHDTLTEDLDLSYRAQLAGWRFVYAYDLVAPAEVPPDIGAFLSQQHRWARGSVQVARKLLVRILRAEVPWRVKLEALAHLTGNGGYPLVVLLALVMPLAVSLPKRWGGPLQFVLFLVCTASVWVFYERAERAIGRPLRARMRDVPAAVALGIGISVSQTRAVLSGLRRETGLFARTPKRGDGRAAGYRALASGLPGLELVLSVWLLFGAVNAVRGEMWGALPFVLLFLGSFAWVGLLGLEARMRSVPAH